MKKIWLLLLLSVFLVGCSGGETAGNNTPVEPVNSVSEDINEVELAETYVFVANGVEIAMNAEVTPVLEKLGESKEYFEAESCAFQGMERTYTYDGFELYTYEIDGVDSVASISFLDDSVKTQEGIYLFSTLDEVLDAYGDNYEENLGLYTYVQGDSKLTFLVDNDEVVSIEYIAITE
ncbi:MAG: hypothetical protein RIN55_06645 [Tissierellaceae bacterium]|nr:hypothetical protein [Tissierellaceae bacterium]